LLTVRLTRLFAMLVVVVAPEKGGGIVDSTMDAGRAAGVVLAARGRKRG